LSPFAVLRCDASPSIGAGHVTRCLALAEALLETGWRVALAVGPETAATAPGLAGEFELQELNGREATEAADLGDRFPGGVDLLVVDHYQRDARFERACRAWARRILVLDDATGRSHDCDLLLDAAAPDAIAYKGLIPTHARALVGPSFALMRRAFVTKREAALKRRDGRPVGAILVSFGATDPSNATPVALAALERFADDISITVAMSARAPHVDDVRRRLRGRTQLALDADMAQLMTDADLAIGAGGASSYERAVLGLPTIIAMSADNQRNVCASLIDAGAAMDGGEFDHGLALRLAGLISALLADPAARIRMAENAAGLVDGRGSRRLLMAIAGEIKLRDGGHVRLRPADTDDDSWLLDLQRAPGTRRYFRNPSIPGAAAHACWMRRTLGDENIVLTIIEADGQSAGMVRLDRESRNGDVARYAVSIAVSPNFRGRGIGSAALRLVRRVMPVALLDAVILPANTASKALFLKAGFVPIGEDHYENSPS
jgi:UDP-2,4-diacetamido-2,4,6-trideoxy-beta-L-altropyranose hydrolase